MTYSAAAPRPGWRDSSLVRILGSGGAWFLFSLSFSLLFQVSLVVMSLGGSCASGGPYEIAVECPDAVVSFAPLSIFGGLLAVGIALVLAQGFGMPLHVWAWPILFVGLGGAFLLAFIFGQDLTGLILGVMFIVMGLAPLVLELRGGAQRTFLGQRSAGGVWFLEGPRARRSLMSTTNPNPEGAVAATALDWLLGLGVPVLGVVLGYFTALAWFASLS